MQDAVKRRDQYKVRIAVEDGGKIYGGNGFEKDGNGTADHIKMDIAGGSDAPETGTWDSKTVPVAAWSELWQADGEGYSLLTYDL